MSNVVIGFFRALVRFRLLVIIGSLALLVLCCIPMGQLYMQQSQEMWLPDADETLDDFNSIRDQFGPNQYLVLAVSAPNAAHPVYNSPTLKTIDEITRYLDGHELVVKVNSLSNHQYMAYESGTLWQHDTVSEEDYLYEPDQVVTAVQERVEADPLSRPGAVNDSQTYARIAALITYREDDVMHHVQIVNDVNQFIEEKGYESSGIEFSFSGFPFIAASTTADLMMDQSIMMPIMILLLVVLLRVVLGRWAYTWVPLAVSVMTILMTLGFMGFVGFPLNMVNSSLTLIVIAIGVADAVHMISQYNKQLTETGDPKVAAVNTGLALWRPCLFTSVTTVLGFLSLGFSDMLPVKEYGYAAAMAIIIAYVLSLTFVLAWLSYLKKPASKSKVVQRLPFVLKKIMAFSMARSRTVLAVSVVLFAFCIALSMQLTADANYLRFFKPSSPVTTGIHLFDREFGGANSLEFSLDSGAENGVLEPEFLQRAAQFQKDVSKIDGVGESLLLYDYLVNMKGVFTGEVTLPSSFLEVAQFLFLYSSSDPIEDLTDLRSFDGQYYRVSLPVKNIDASEMRSILDSVNTLIDEHYSDLNVILSGDLYLQHQTEHYIQINLVESFSIALITIMACLLVVFRSLTFGLVSLLPSLMPMFFAAGIMAVTGVYLDFGTMIVASIMIGIAVDDTIHIISDYLSSRRKGKNVLQALDHASEHSGAAVTSTSLILLFAFSVMSFSSFMPNVYFGLFSSIIIIGALLANLVFLPALLIEMEKFANRKSLVEVKE